MPFRRNKDIERLLRAQRPEPGDELVRSLAGRARKPLASRSRPRLAFTGALSAGMLVVLTAFGGLGYAATTVTSVAKTIEKVVAPGSSHAVASINLSSGGDQYKPGYGWGDKHHVHSGPPGIKREKPVQRRHFGKALHVSTAVSIDEQAHLTISVLGPRGKLQILQNRSKIGTDSKGPSTKNLQYLVLVPRTIPLDIAIPTKNIVHGALYKIRIAARSPINVTKVFTITFSG
jgi:hypothetical protein